MNAQTSGKKGYLDLLRILAIFMVFHFHFIIVLNQQGPLYGFANGDWGCVGTSLFFLISGNCLARNYGKQLDVKKFYIKRWLSIFPAFYLCYLLVLFGHTVLLQNQVLAGLSPWRLIFTVLGIDNYMNFLGIANGALVGEWYTAIILGIYLLFPVLQFLYRKNKWIGSLLVYGLYAVNLFLTWGPVPDDAHLLTGIAVFWTGMLVYHFEEKLEQMPWPVWGLLVIGAVIFLLVPLPGPQLLRKNVFALLIFLILMKLGTVAGNIFSFKPIHFLSKIEYGIYLCHHTVLYVMLSMYTHILGDVNPILYYALCLVATLIFATIINYLTQWLLSSLKKVRQSKNTTA